MFEKALEGKEFETKIGEYGSASVDVKPDLKVAIGLQVEIDLIAEVKKLADKTKTPIDNSVIEWLEKLVKAPQA